MEISKNSWHYKLNSLFAKKDYLIPSSLCPYFWYTVFSIIKSVGLLISASLLTAIVFFFLKWFLSSLSIYWTNDLRESFFAWLIFGFVGWAITAAAAKEWHENNYKWVYPDGCSGYGTKALKQPVPWWLLQITLPNFELRERPYNPSSFSAVTAKYIRTWHEKVCPSITFTD